MTTGHRYNVLTYDWDERRYTPQKGLDAPSVGVSLGGVRRALRELKTCGYDCGRQDPSVLVERVEEGS